MSDQTMFDDTGGNTPQEPVPATPEPRSEDPFADKLSSILNENGEPKYKDVATALDALRASQEFISKLKSEKTQVEEKAKTLEAELAKKASIEDFVNRVSQNPQSQEPTKTKEDVTELSEEKVAAIIQNQLQSSKQEEIQNRNLELVVNKLSEVHGDKSAAHIQEVASRLGTTPAALKDIAKSNPKMALELLGGGSTQFKSSSPSQPSNTSNINSDGTIEKPTIEKGKGAARGGMTSKELTDIFRKSAAYTNNRLGLE